jgi:hypothetical protein
MGIGMFDTAEPVEAKGVSLEAGQIRLKVGGPLQLAEGQNITDEYCAPAVVRFLLVHVPEGVDEDDAAVRGTRARGVVTVDDFSTGRWEGVVTVDEAFGKPGETRGIAVAVLEQRDRFAFETLTWCDPIKLGEAAAAAPRS